MKRSSNLLEIFAALAELLVVAVFLVVLFIFVITLLNRLHPLNSLINTFHPSAEVADLAKQANFTDEGLRIFYSASPQIDQDRNSFENHCSAPVTPNSVELGCYTPDKRIYILKINDQSLQSEMVVVAAHEMLHAAYATYSDSEKQTLDKELENQVSALNSQKLNQEIKSYNLNEPGQRENELHSLLGTEFSPLNSDLEKHYSQYFNDRSQIVQDHNQFNDVFDSLTNEISNLRGEIRNTRNQMNFYLRRGQIENYNNLVGEINNLVNSYNADVVRYNELSRSLLGEESPVSNQ